MERAPLSGYRVVVVESAALAGLLLGRGLADLGAEVAVLETAGGPPIDREALLRNTFSARPRSDEEWETLYRNADVVILGEGAPEPPSLQAGGITVRVPSTPDDGTDLAWLLATAGCAAVSTAIYRRRKTGQGARITLDPVALTALLGLGGGREAQASLPPADPRTNAHLRKRGFYEPVGGHEAAASPWVIGGAPVHTRTPAPQPGEHTDLLLQRFGEGPARQ
ncbi:MAG: hypothetical protein EXR43_04670 [Dehalococcoidia bacterium]|nr:hypothetical protein [Dehalococcoidia bacterium]